MPDNQSETVLIYRVDDASVNKAERRIKDIEKANKSLSKSLNETGDVSSTVAKELERIGRQSQLDKVVKDAVELQKKTKDADSAVLKLTTDLRNLNATETESRGAAQSFSSATSGSKGRGIIGEVGLQVRNAPAVPIPGLGITTEPISKAAIALDRFKENLGATTANILGLGAAMIGLAVAFSLAQKAAEDNTRLAQAQVSGLLNVNDLQNASTEGLIASTQEYSNTLRNNQEDLATTKDTLSQFETALNETDGGLLRFNAELGNMLGIAGTELGVLRTKITELSAGTAEAQANFDAAIQVLRDRGFTEEQITQITLQATEAEKALAAERAKGIIAASQQAGELEAARQSTEDRSREELQAQIESEENRIAQLKESLAVLENSGDTSKEVTAQIASLNAQLDTSSKKVDIYRGALTGAQSDVQKSAQEQVRAAAKSKAVAEAAGQMSGELQKAESALRSVGQSATKTSTRTGILTQRRISTTQNKEAKELEKASMNYQKKLSEINRSLIQNLNEIGTSLADAKADLTIDAQRDIRDALSEGQFLSIRNIQRDFADDRADLERKASRDRRDAQIRANQELLDLQAQFLQAQIGQLRGAIKTIGGNRQQNFVSITPRS